MAEFTKRTCGTGAPRPERRPFLRAALIGLCWVLTAGTTMAAQPMSLRFLGSSFSVWPTPSTFIPNPADPNGRVLVFTPPQGFPTGFDGQTNSAEFWGAFPYPVTGVFPDNPLSNNNWPPLTNSFAVGAICSGDTTNDYASADTEVNIEDFLWPMQANSTVDDALQAALDWWATQQTIPPETFSSSDFEITLKVKGGRFDGQTLTLPAAVATAAALDPFGDAHNQHAVGDLFLVVDWGVDLMTNRDFVIFHFSSIAYAYGGDHCLSLPTLCQQWLGSPDALSYEQIIWNNIKNQLSGGQAYIQGAVPDFVYFYDFSGQNTLPPFKFVPSVAYTPPEPDFAEVNQYDAGFEFGLRIAAGDPRRGGNACGPTSLNMAMNAFGFQESAPDVVFANTMSLGTGQNGWTNLFHWLRAQAWLQGRTNFNNVAFPNPLNASIPVDLLEDNPPDQGWPKVDNLLARKQPVLLRTDLGAGFGHVILLVGKGRSAKVGQLYGTSGDYYIVADPAGHYFANSNRSFYDQVENLQNQWLGVNYGGWFAAYPVEKLRAHVTLDGVPVVRALTLGAPFSSVLEVQARCPVTILVTDPVGNQTGLQTNGAVVQGIPQSYFEADNMDSEDGSAVDPDGPKTVRIETPLAGTYRVDLVGTNSGSYTLVSSQLDATGVVLGTNSFGGTISPGQQVTYFVTASPSDPPPLLVARQSNAIRLFWPTNYSGFTLQTTGTPSSSNTWASAGGVSVEGAFNVFTNPFSAGNRFFRLKK